jgi:chromosome segregation ATPase
MEVFTVTCTCDDLGESPCPRHQRESELQNQLLEAREQLRILEGVRELVDSLKAAHRRDLNKLEDTRRQLNGAARELAKVRKELDDARGALASELCRSREIMIALKTARETCRLGQLCSPSAYNKLALLEEG